MRRVGSTRLALGVLGVQFAVATHWYAGGRWDERSIRALFARAKIRRYSRGVNTPWTYVGAEPGHWVLQPPLSESELALFEAELVCELPEPFRAFLAQIGRGGPGPGYGLFSEAGPPDGEGSFVVTRIRSRLHRERPKALVIADYGCAMWPMIVLGGPLSGQMWIRDNGESRPLYSDGSYRAEREGRVVVRHDFASWYSEWLDEIEAIEDQLDPLDVPQQDVAALTDRLARIGEISQFRQVQHAADLEAALADAPVISAAALRSLAVVQPSSAITFARSSIADASPILADAALDVLTALGEPRDVPRLLELRDAEPVSSGVPMDQPRRVQIETALWRLGILR